MMIYLREVWEDDLFYFPLIGGVSIDDLPAFIKII